MRAAFPTATSICYDEGAAKDSGPILSLLLSGNFQSEGWAHYPYLPYYKYVYGLIPQVLLNAEPSDMSDLVGARWMGALLGSGIVVMTFLVGVRFLSVAAAFFGALLLASFPTVLGHDRIAMHDAPSRLLCLVGWWLVLKAFTGPRGASDESADGHRSGCPLGSASPLRPSAFSLRPLLWGAGLFGLGLTFFHRTAVASGLAVAIFLLVRLMQRVRPRSSVGQAHQQPSIARKGDGGPPAGVSSAGGVLRTLALFGTVSLGTWILSAFLLWPYMWFRPWELIRWYADPLATAGGGGSIEFWFGRIRTVPWFYYLVAIAVSTPPLTLLASTGWQVAALWRPRSVEGRLPILLLIWIPLLVCSLTVRQGLTHYLQIMMPGLCLGAGAGAWRVGGWLAHRWKIPRRTATGSLVALMVLMHVYACWSVRPYFFEYFNSLVGGGGGVTRHRLFSQGVYGEAIQPLFDYV
ncbi:MAG: hypothetical protein IT578_05955, partial [Verrucomicrobiae bacterium]|nr:hypothetical protein [Verrucomicrobiae bacterium]